MKITDIKMTKSEESYLRTVAKFDVVFDDCFAIHNISLVKRYNSKENEKDLFIGFYSTKDPNGKYINVCHPINSEFRNYIEDTLIKYYNEN